ncbi:MAG: hypothetical protein ACYTF0_01560, partial [Planctomycetota bacterium]
MRHALLLLHVVLPLAMALALAAVWVQSSGLAWYPPGVLALLGGVLVVYAGDRWRDPPPMVRGVLRHVLLILAALGLVAVVAAVAQAGSRLL